MAGTLAPTEESLKKRIAVRLNNCVLVYTKTVYCGQWIYNLWIYNLWTEQWSKHAIAEPKELPDLNGQTGVVIGTDVYVLGGYNDVLWKLIRNANGSYVWSVIRTDNQTNAPSPRYCHCAWAYGEKMWVFGGYGPSPVGYLNDHGDFDLWNTFNAYGPGANNQLLSFDPSTKTWTNVECFGDIPSPRDCACTTMIEDTVWLYGGRTCSNFFNNDFYELNMLSFVWTKIKTTMPRPDGISGASLTSISASKLVLYGGCHQDMDDHNLAIPRVFDIQSRTWSQHPTTETCHRIYHSGLTGLNSSVIILGGETSGGSQHHRENAILYVRLEPKCLQQLALQMIYTHKSELPWKSLPKKLTCQIMDPK